MEFYIHVCVAPRHQTKYSILNSTGDILITKITFLSGHIYLPDAFPLMRVMSFWLTVTPITKCKACTIKLIIKPGSIYQGILDAKTQKNNSSETAIVCLLPL